jgi:toxin ParE1/3/4
MAEVSFRPEAKEDLDKLYTYILRAAGPGVANGYIGRIENAVMALAHFPHRGTRRDDLAPGIRTLGFERRVTIVFLVDGANVEIVRVFYGGQDIDAVFRDDPSPSDD